MLQIISASGSQIIAVQNPALTLSESLSLKSSIPSTTDTASPPTKFKKIETSLSSSAPTSTTYVGDRQIRPMSYSTVGTNFRDSGHHPHLPRLQQTSPVYRHAYAMNNAALMESTSAVATLLNLSRRDAAQKAAAAVAVAAFAASSNGKHDNHSTIATIASDRESPSSSSSNACATSSGYPRPKRDRGTSNNSNDVDTNEDGEQNKTCDLQKDTNYTEGKKKDDACDIDENFLGEVKQEPMSPPHSSPSRVEHHSSLEPPFTSSSLQLSLIHI